MFNGTNFNNGEEAYLLSKFKLDKVNQECKRECKSKNNQNRKADK